MHNPQFYVSDKRPITAEKLRTGWREISEHIETLEAYTVHTFLYNYQADEVPGYIMNVIR